MRAAVREIDRIAELEEENAWLRAQLQVEVEANRVSFIREALRLTTQQAHLVCLLHNHRLRITTTEFLETWLPITTAEDVRDDSFAKVIVHNLRRRLGRDFIETSWGIGYRLSPRALAVLDELQAQIP